MLPNSKIIISAMNKILKAFEDAVQMELIKVRWEEIKRLNSQSDSLALCLPNSSF